MREGQKRINVYLPEDLYARVLRSEYNDMTEAVIKGLAVLLEPHEEDFKSTSDTKNTQDSFNPLQEELIRSLRDHITSLESQIMVKDEQLRTQAVHLQTVLTQKYIAPPAKRKEEKKEDKPSTKQEHVNPQKKEDMHAQKTAKTMLEKTCKNCQQTFFTENPRKETCSDKCRTAFNRRKSS